MTRPSATLQWSGGRWRQWRKSKVVKTEVEGGPRGFRGGEDRKEKTEFCGECWSCGGCHHSDRCESRWKRQLANTVRRLVQGGKSDLWIANEVREMIGQVRRPKQPGPAAVKVVELPRPRPKEGGAGVLASVHAIAEERRPKTKTKTEIKTEEAEAEQATHRQEEESRWAADAEAARAVQGQVSEIARMVKDLKRQRVSTDREIKLQRAWVEGELEERAMAAQVEQVKGSMSELASELAAVREQARELASRELAAVREQEARSRRSARQGSSYRKH
jgi:hypothetical protein